MIRVMLADDQAMVRGALAALLALEADIEVVAQVGNGDDVLPVALEHRPDVVLMDVDMPGTDGLSATASLLERLPATRVLIVTTFGRPGFLRRAIQSGAHGFVVKDAPDVVERRTHRGGKFPPQAADGIAGLFQGVLVRVLLLAVVGEGQQFQAAVDLGHVEARLRVRGGRGRRMGCGGARGRCDGREFDRGGLALPRAARREEHDETGSRQQYAHSMIHG